MIGNLHDGVKHVKLAGNVAAGKDGSVVASSAIATAGFDRIRVCIELGAVTDTGALEAFISGCSTSNGSFTSIVSFDDEGDGVVVSGKSDKTVILDCKLGLGAEFVKINYQRTVANIELDGIYYDLYASDIVPVVQDTSVLDVVAV